MDDGTEFQVGDVVQRGGEQLRYLGGGRWERLEMLAKRFAVDEGEMLGGVRAAMSRLAQEVK